MDTPAIKATADLPKLPSHPEHYMKWTTKELEAISQYGEACAAATLATPAIQAVAPILTDKSRLGANYLLSILKRVDEGAFANDEGKRARAAYEELCEFIDDRVERAINSALAAIPAQAQQPTYSQSGSIRPSAEPAGQHKSKLSDYILDTMYRACQRGDSVERMHKMVMELVTADVERLLSHSAQAPDEVSALTDEQIEAEAKKYAEFVPPDSTSRPGDYDVTRYECREDFFNCVRACAALLAASPKVEPVSDVLGEPEYLAALASQ